MDKIKIQLFGIPQIYVNDEKVFFPYSKINALIYYLIINKSASRDEVSGLLWPDDNEKNAKKNLRNALYQAKKCVGTDFIVSPKKSILEIDSSINIECDALEFDKHPEKNLDKYTGDFLQGFFLKEAEGYELWITKMRNYFQEKFVNVSYDEIESSLDSGNYINIERNISALTEIDEFDERNYRLLMKFYQATDRNSKVIEIYYNLSKLLKDELGVSPDMETKKIYEESLKKINIDNKKMKVRDEFFYGRFVESATISKLIEEFRNGSSKSILIQGEAGIGKSTLKRKILENVPDDLIVLQSFCYQAEENYALRPFGIIIDKLSKLLGEYKMEIPKFWDIALTKLFPTSEFATREINLYETKQLLNFDVLIQIIVEAIQKISEKKKLFIVFEDIQWMDQTSIKLLTSVMLHLENEAMFLLTTRKQNNLDIENMVVDLRRYDKIEEVELNRFSKDESAEFLKKALPDFNFSEDVVNTIYKETEGNLLFLSEYVHLLKTEDVPNLMNEKIMDTIKSRFNYLSKPEHDLIDIISFFYDEAPLNILCDITGQQEYELISILESLENKYLLTEVTHQDNVGILFTHSKLREYIYMQQPESKKKIIHKRIAQILESKLNKKTDLYTFSKLVYHFSCAGEESKTIKYKVETLNYYLNFSHELFPILNFSELEEDEKIYISRDKIKDVFDKLNENFIELKAREQSRDIDLLEVEFYYMKGRYLIRDGNYEEGLADIKYVITKAKEIDAVDYVLDGYKQMIFYNIQTNKSFGMIEYIDLALDLAVKCNYHKEIGILLRLKGLYNIMVGDIQTAEKLLRESINTFMVTTEVANRYAINIAAAHNYIGEIKLSEGNFQEAIDEFTKSIELSIDKNALSSLSIFYINIGKAFFVLGDMDKSREYFDKAYDLYGQFDSFWKRPVLDSYMCLINISSNRYEDALENITNAVSFSSKMNDPRALGTVYFAEYNILKNIESNPIAEKFLESIDEDIEFYREKAIENLDKYRDRYELNLLK